MELVYRRTGAGPPLVLMHGIGHHWQAWQPVIDLLARHHDVIAVDLPGFGASPPLPPGTISTAESLAYAVEAFWHDLGIEEPHVAGNSLGGYLALDMASRGVCRTATAISPAGYWSRTELLWLRSVLKVMRMGPITRKGLGLVVAHPERVSDEVLHAGWLALKEAPGFYETLDAFYWMPPPAPPKVPVTIAWGEKDRLLPKRQAVRAGRWAQKRVHLLPDCGHVPMTDDPELVARVLLSGARAAN
ncbi:alpha/beta fold hydrolase [Herbidospora galbida]|uniref:Alpha/beta fold hydrolase n=1 Tax=Herbidospora galbida TaxID=2575442 RepID=A0A4V5V1Q5_9ACTN|nr:alpha/beta fold hydrolase [Herbidospora galbida]TKK90923.1 alpha/beta fold hydrolase [Herbidospora galbida]